MSEFENNSAERDLEMDQQTNEPQQSKNLNDEELVTLTNSLTNAKDSQADKLPMILFSRFIEGVDPHRKLSKNPTIFWANVTNCQNEIFCCSITQD